MQQKAGAWQHHDSALNQLRSQLREWYSKFQRPLPWREPSATPYQILVSEFMLQQTTVAAVVPYFHRWLERWPTLYALSHASEQEVLAMWEGLGYYRRARFLLQLAQACSKTDWQLPTDQVALRALPGLGQYTAAAVAAFAFHNDGPVIDTNVERVLARLSNLQEPTQLSRTKRMLWHLGARLTEGSGDGTIAAALMELGATVCSPRKPQCLTCPIRDHCAAEHPESLPIKQPRATVTAAEEDVLWSTHNGCLALQQSSGPRWVGLWKLPTGASADPQKLKWATTYSITRYRVSLRVWEGDPKINGVEWVPMCELKSMPICAPHRRVIRKLLHDT
ncbi:MAG: A/G-specific adenine glycosylase [Verrucomicrobiales bacterium]